MRANLNFLNVLGDPILDLIPIHLDIFRGDVQLLKKLLESYKLPFGKRFSSNDGCKVRKISYLAMWVLSLELLISLYKIHWTHQQWFIKTIYNDCSWSINIQFYKIYFVDVNFVRILLFMFVTIDFCIGAIVLYMKRIYWERFLVCERNWGQQSHGRRSRKPCGVIWIYTFRGTFFNGNIKHNMLWSYQNISLLPYLYAFIGHEERVVSSVSLAKKWEYSYEIHVSSSVLYYCNEIGMLLVFYSYEIHAIRGLFISPLCIHYFTILTIQVTSKLYTWKLAAIDTTVENESNQDLRFHCQQTRKTM